ncbi:MAG: hypothetical protein H7222_16350, partial [Methylotenera sp.]|nr:hypothetical protein [Oligoflexia bacterium]
MTLQGLKKFCKAYAPQFSILLMAMLWLAFIAVSWAEAAGTANGAQAAGRQLAGMSGDAPAKSDEYDFSWLDPEKKIYVLQNRRYLKANHIMLSAMIGSASSNPYRNAQSFEGRATYFINEAFAIEAFYT